jgi:single-strand DNA-binding protein
MARGLNKVMLIGRIQPNDPELRYTQSGQPVCHFKLVTDDSYKDRDGNLVERSEWHQIVAWGKVGEIIAQYTKKGSQIYLEGKIQTRKFEDREGQTRYITEINVSDFTFLDSAPRAAGEGDFQRSAPMREPASTSPTNAPAPGSGEDDLPF